MSSDTELQLRDSDVEIDISVDQNNEFEDENLAQKGGNAPEFHEHTKHSSIPFASVFFFLFSKIYVSQILFDFF